MTILQGRVLKNYNGYYYVQAGSDIYTCKVKGKMKQNRFSLASGDMVAFDGDGDKHEGMITTVLPRKNFMPRPTVANLDLLVVTFACVSPDFSYILADKLLAMAEIAHIPAMLVLNKADLADPGKIEEIRRTYESIGYEVFVISAATGSGVDELRKKLHGKICAFGGPSGVGKSSTLNAIDPAVELCTGVISEKIGRGRHTTRYTQLLPFDGGYIADTPGFGNLLLEELAADGADAAAGFREFAQYEQGCRFCPCTHTHEPVCGVKQAVEEGRVAATRDESYLALRAEIKDLQEKEGRR